MGMFGNVKRGVGAARKARRYYKTGKQIYDDGRLIYDDVKQNRYAPYNDQTDIDDIKAREKDPNYDNSAARTKREKLAGKLRDTAGKLQDAEDNPIMYTGKDGKQRESKWNGIRKKGIIIGGVGGAGLFGG